MIDPYSSLQRSVFMSRRGFSYFAQTPGLPLSLKCMVNGRALYKIDRAEFAVDDGGYLILIMGSLTRSRLNAEPLSKRSRC